MTGLIPRAPPSGPGSQSADATVVHLVRGRAHPGCTDSRQGGGPCKVREPPGAFPLRICPLRGRHGWLRKWASPSFKPVSVQGAQNPSPQVFGVSTDNKASRSSCDGGGRPHLMLPRGALSIAAADLLEESSSSEGKSGRPPPHQLSSSPSSLNRPLSNYLP